MSHRSIRHSMASQSGLTMVELLVALLIGLFLMGGLIGLLQSNKRAFTSQSGLAQLQDAERLAMTMINDVVAQAGYFPDPTTYTPSSTLAAVAPFAAGQSLAGTYGGGAAPGDTISVRYTTAPGDGIVNCAGTSNPLGAGANATYTNQFSVIKNAAGVWQLVCTLNGVAYPLVNNVTNMAVTYGVNTTGSGDNVDTYMNATQVTATGNWGNVISAKVQLTFVNPLYNAPGQSSNGQPATVSVKRSINLMKQIG